MKGGGSPNELAALMYVEYIKAGQVDSCVLSKKDISLGVF